MTGSMRTGAPAGSGFVPERLVLLSGDPADPVSRALRTRGAELGCPLTEITAHGLGRAVEFGEHWVFGATRIDPARSALVNRLPMADRLEPTGPDDAASAPARQAAWTRLRVEIDRFGYASALPTPTSLAGCFGSLADLWADLPRWVAGLRVPEHVRVGEPAALEGRDIHVVNRWALYQLGRPRSEQPADDDLPDALRLEYRRPAGRLAVLTQVGGTLLFANPPPEMSRAQADAIVAFARRFAAVSPQRIVEHVFFLSGDAPVLYSSCPVPVLSGSHPAYPQLVIQGLGDDIVKHGRVAGR